MDIDLDTFLQQEKQRLLAEKQRLSARSTITANAAVHCNNNNNENSNCNARAVENEVECAAVRMMQSMRNLNEIKCNRSKNSVLDKELLQQAIQRVAERHNNSNNNNNSIKEDNNILQNCHQADVNELVVSASKTECASTAVSAAANVESSLATVGPHYTPVSLPPPSNSQCMPNADVLDFYHYFAKDIDKENASSAPGASINGDVANESMPENPLNNAMLMGDDEWGSKSQKELANQKELKSLNINEGKARTQQELNTLAGLRKKGNKDDMEQWVSDTFYSYFPGFNNEYQKRQNYLQERQREYQQNLLKHQQMTSNSVKPKNAYASHDANTLPTTARSNATTTTTNTTNSSATDKTDLEIIVNNPNYTPKYNNFAHNARPGSTRHKLLQDLRHTELSNIVTGDGVTERNRQSAEIELARKKDYQRELMQQIEEKRRSVELLREKERRQEEALTRRLQEQLKTMQLEEELEKEKLRVEKLRFNTEQNRIMREQLLAKLENDGKLLNSQRGHKKVEIRSEQASGKSSSLDSHQSDANNNNNKVYKYFSNSARHEYRRGQPLPANVELDLDLPESLTMPQDAHTERECFHLSDKVCPMCDAPLRSYESCCLRCQRKLSLKMTQAHGSNAEVDAKSMQATTAAASAPMAVAQSYSLVCSKCERLYALCSSCLAKSDVCRACHRERNVCMNCRRSLCSFCLEEIASGRDVEQSHINEQQRQQQSDNKNEHPSNEKKIADSQRSFKVLDVKYNAEPLDDNEAVMLSSNQLSYNNNNNTTIFNSNKLTNKHPPYSINIERNSIFHPDYEPSTVAAFAEQLPKVLDKNLSFDLDSSSFTHPDVEENLERVRKETDRRLSRYVKNYGDLTIKHQRSLSESRDRSTQTTPHTAARRDVVLHEEHNLSMPLLREMPRMTRRETPTQLVAAPSNKQRRIIDNLHRRWEIPAVQKYSISPTSPPVLTQVGAIRKQLQTERILSDDY